jgi:tetratricopeptide (TPR) repeat protein
MKIGELIKNANQLKREGKLDEAIANYYQVIEFSPNFAWAYSNLGDALVKQDYLDEAINCIEKAILINKNTSYFYYQISDILAKKGRLDQALFCFKHFLKISDVKHKLKLNIKPINSEFWNTEKVGLPWVWQGLKHSSFLAQQGTIETAEKYYKKILEQSPYQYSEIYNSLGEILIKKGEQKKAVTNFKKAILINPNIAQYHLNLGEALERWSFSVQSYRTAVKLDSEALKNYYDTVKPGNIQEIKVKNPIFVVGCGHSGTSVMLALLGNHPSFYPIPYESAVFLESLSKIEETMQSWDEDCLAAGKSRWVEKTPPHIFQIGKFLKLRPQSQFIIMLRDGRDVVCSLKHRPDYQKFLDRLDRWIYDNVAGLLYWDDPRVKVVKYEDLVTTPEITLQQIFEFLGEEYGDQVLEFYKTEKLWYSSEMVKPEKIDSLIEHKQYRNWQINQPLFDGRGRWQEEMTEGEKIIFKKKAQEYLVKFGYVEDDTW